MAEDFDVVGQAIEAEQKKAKEFNGVTATENATVFSSQTPERTGQPVDPNDVVGLAIAEEDQKTSAALSLAAQTDPDLYAKATKFTTRDGIPLEQALKSVPILERNEAASQAREVLKQSPTLREVFNDHGGFIKHDELANTHGIERLASQVAGAWGQGRQQLDFSALTWDRDIMHKQLTPDQEASYQQAMRDYGGETRDFDARGLLESTAVGLAGIAPGMLYGGVEAFKGGVVGAAKSAAIGAAAGSVGGPGGALAGAAAGFTSGMLVGGVSSAVMATAQQEGGAAYQEIKRIKTADGKPVPDDVARWAALGVGYVNGVIETGADAFGLRFVPGFDKLAGAVGRKAVVEALKNPTVMAAFGASVREALKSGAVETGTEVAQRFVTMMGAAVAGGSGATDQSGQIKYSSPASYIAEGVQEAAGAVQSMWPLALIGAAPHFAHQVSRVQSAERNAALAQQMHELAKNNAALRERSPETAQALGEAASKASGIESVFVPAEKLDALFQSGTVTPADMEQAIPGFAQQYQEAKANEKDVEISFADFHSKIAGTQVGEALLGDTRFAPDQPTLNEAIQWRKEEKERTDSFLADIQARQSQEVARDSVTAELYRREHEKLLAAGMTPDEAVANATVNASVWHVMAERAGQDPLQFHDTHAPTVQRVYGGETATQAAAAQARNQGTIRPASEVATSREQLRPAPAADFRAAIQAAKDADPVNGGSVHVYGEEDYAGFKTFLSEDGTAGFAVKPDGDIVSVFNHPTLGRRGRGAELVQNAIAMGGRKLDAFEGPLTNLYKSQGFTEVAREPWNDAYAPEGWDYAKRGTPDNVYLQLPDVLDQSANELRETPHLLEAFGLERNAAGGVNTRKLAEALERWSRERHGEIARDDRSEETANQIGGYIADEVLREINDTTNPNSAVGWYTTKWQAAIDQFGELFPELLTDKTARDTFTLFFAMTSDGQKVMANAALAVQAYRFFRENGRAPVGDEFKGGGERTAGMQANLRAINSTMEMTGSMEELHRLFAQTDTVKNLKKIAKEMGLELATSYTADMELPYSAIILGPKLGAFYANLMGSTGYLTMDRWWTRSFNRYRGQLIPKVSATAMERVKGLVGKPGISDEAVLPYIIEARNSYEEKNFKDGTELEKAANTLWKDIFLNTEDQPFNATDRKFMFTAAQKAQQQLREQGHEITIADIQAVLWYYEKRLYAEMGVRPSGDVSYAEAASKIVAEQRGDRPNGPDLARAAEGAASNPADDPGVAGNNQTAQLAEGYKREAGISKPALAEGVQPDEGFLRAVADWLDTAEHRPNDADVKAAYDALAKETVAQYAYLVKHSGVQVEAWDGKGEPYKNSKAMMRDVAENKHLWFFRTENGFGETGMDPNHPLVQPTQFKDQQGRTLLVNDLFRVVHDFFGHTQHGFQFGPVGEYNAFQEHARMFTDAAVPALAAETLAQNAWVNYGPHLRRPDGTIPVKGDKDYIAQRDRPFAEQKSTVVPASLLARDPNPEATTLNQGPRGQIQFGTDGTRAAIRLFDAADASTFQHESAHLWLRMMRDLAAAPGADQSLVQDWAAIREYLGVGEDGKLSVDQEEKWARSWEAYLYEGKAPSEAVRGAFARFSAWLRFIYRTITKLNVPINDDIRAVFDRMVASEDEISQLQGDPTFGSVFKTAEEAGMGPKEWETYQRNVAQSNAAALEEMTSRMLDDIAREHTREWRKRKAAVREEVTNELKNTRVHQVVRFLTTGKMFDEEQQTVPPMKLWTPEIIQRYGRDVAAELRRMTTNEAGGIGAQLDDVAETFGYSSGDEMIQEIRGNTSFGRAVTAEVDARMAAQYGDMMQDRTARIQAAEKAAHSQARGDAIEAEMQALGRRALLAPDRLVARRFARQLAQQQIAFRNASQLRVAPYVGAERKAALRSMQLALKGDFQGAAEYKRRQLFAHEMVLAVKEAQAEVTKALKYLRKFTDMKRPDGVAFDYLDQIDAMLERFDFRQSTGRAIQRRQSLRDYIQQNEGEGVLISIPEELIEETYRKSWREMTVDEIQGFRDAIKSLEHTGRWKADLQEGANRRAFQDKVAELTAAAAKQRQKGITDPRVEKSFSEKMKNKMLGIAAAMVRIEQVIDFLDNGRVDGPWRKHVFERFVQAQNAENDMQVEYTAKLRAIFDTAPKDHLATQVYLPSVGKSYSMEAIYAFALNTGSASNMEKMLRGEAFVPGGGLDTTAKLQEALDHLTKEDWDRIQQIWDTVNSLWPALRDLQTRLTGVAPEKVEAREVPTPHGTYRGGYYPMVYDREMTPDVDRRADEEADRLMSDKSFIAPTVAHGHRIARTGYAAPISTSMNVAANHVMKVIHDVTHWEAVRDVYALLNHSEVKAAIESTFGRAIQKETIKWVNRVANDRNLTPETDLEKVMGQLRSRASVMGMGYRISTIVTQFVGWSNSMEHVKPSFLAGAIMKTSDIAMQGEVHQFIMDSSGEMRHRANTMERDVREHMRRMVGEEGMLSNFKRFAFYGITFADRIVSETTWLGAYNQHLALNPGAHDEAVIAGDRAVRLSQGSGGAKDIATIQNSKGGLSLFTQFYSYFGLYFNRLWALGRDVRTAYQDGTLVTDMPHLMARVMAHTIIPAVMSDLLVFKGPGHDDLDKDGWLQAYTKWAAKKILLYPFASVPIIREAANAIAQGRPSSSTPAQRPLEVATQLAVTASKKIHGEDIDGRVTAKRVAELTGYAFGLPVGQFVTTGDNIWRGIAQDDFRAQDLFFSREPKR